MGIRIKIGYYYFILLFNSIITLVIGMRIHKFYEILGMQG